MPNGDSPANRAKAARNRMRNLTSRLRSAGTLAVEAGTNRQRGNAPGQAVVAAPAAPAAPRLMGAAAFFPNARPRVNIPAPPVFPPVARVNSPAVFFPGRSGSPLAFPLNIVQLRGDQAEAVRESERTGVLKFPMVPVFRGGRKRNTRKRKRNNKSQKK